MATTNPKIPLDDTDRLKKAAFWYWEYMRRNELYRRYCDVFEKYHDYFKAIGVFEFMQSKEYLEEMMEYLSTHEDPLDLKYPLFRRRLDYEHGDEAGHRYFKYGFLSCGFEMKFGRIYKHYSDGLDTSKTLEQLLKGENISFETSDPADTSALTKLNGSWLVSVDDDMPNNLLYDLERSKSITLDPKGVLNEPAKVGLDVHALNLINKAVESIFGKQNVDIETLQSVYKRNLSGKYIFSSDIMRLSMLWVWDKAHEDDRLAPLPFDEVYPLLKSEIERAGIPDGGWDQILTRKKRMVEYYDATIFCVKNCTLRSLNK